MSVSDRDFGNSASEVMSVSAPQFYPSGNPSSARRELEDQPGHQERSILSCASSTIGPNSLLGAETRDLDSPHQASACIALLLTVIVRATDHVRRVALPRLRGNVATAAADST